MSRYRWSLFYTLAVLITLITVSCSQPGQDLQSAKDSQTATAETILKSDAEAAPRERPKRPVAADEVKKKAAEPLRAAASPRPAPASLPAPPAAAAPAAPPAPARQTVASA